jgi:hypothetical protein
MWTTVFSKVRRLYHRVKLAADEAVESRLETAPAYPQVARFAGEMLKKEKFAKCALFSFRVLAPKP